MYCIVLWTDYFCDLEATTGATAFWFLPFDSGSFSFLFDLPGEAFVIELFSGHGTLIDCDDLDLKCMRYEAG